MGKIYEQQITDFSGGMTSDVRIKDTRFCQFVKNFDAHSFKTKLVPNRSSESGDGNAATSRKQNFCVALCKDLSATSNPYALFGLGVKTGETKAEILYKILTTFSPFGDTDFDDDDWATPSDTNHQSTNTFTWFELFVYYKKTGLIYGAGGTSATAGTIIWAFYPNANTAFVETSYSVPSGFTSITQGLVHSSNDILFVGADNRVLKNDNGSWSVALTLPTNLKITSLSERGGYLGISCAPLSGVGNSKVFLWDMSSTTWFGEPIDWGEGNLMVLEELDGALVGISYVDGFNSKIVYRTYAGGKAEIFQEFVSKARYTAGNLKIAKQKVNNYLYFILGITASGAVQKGIYKIGRLNSSRPFSVVLHSTAENDTATGEILNFYIYNEYIFISYVNGSAAYALSKTLATATYTASSVYETIKIGDAKKKFKLTSAGAMTEYLPTDGQVVLEYKKDEDTDVADWTTIFTHTTNNSLFHEAINIESSGATLPQFRELQLQVISTGGAVITGIWCKYEEIEDGLTQKL